MTEEEIQQRIEQRVDEKLREYFAMKRPGFNIESNCLSQEHGIAEFIVATDANQGIQFYEKGNAKVVANKSVEITAGGKNEDQDAFCIMLDAKNGHIEITAHAGDLILKGGNVKIIATDDEGDVFINSQKTASLDAPEVTVRGTKVDVSATSDCHIQGGTCEIYSQTGDVMFASGQDAILGPTLLDTIINFADRAENQIGIGN